jgi:hypothetical protein
MQILPRDLETIGILEDDLQPGSRGFRPRPTRPRSW